jgi:hypothetical protein
VGRRPLLLCALAACACALATAAPASAAVPPVKHVFVILLENENADSTFGPQTKAPYLARTLTARGQLIPNYFAVTHESLGNYIALVSGQGSNSHTQSDCLVYTEMSPGTTGPNGQALGQGCVYPPSVKTIADQLAAREHPWKGYMEDMRTPCRHPAIGARDDTQSAEQGDQYAARHNPFVYFHSILDGPDCAKNDVPLERLPGDLGSQRRTASYSFITPNLCHDGHDEPCVNGEPGGMTSADLFLRHWVPRIQASAAYRAGGLLVITFDEAEQLGSEADGSACCNQPQFPNTINNGGPVPGRGGGRIGAVVLSPFVRPGSVSRAAYNHFSLLRSSEDLFHLAHLGYAAQPGLRAFGSDVYNAGKPRVVLGIKPRRLRRRTKISYRLSQPARVDFRVDRCVRPRRGGFRRRCLRWRVRGAFHRNGLAGANSLTFRRKLGGRRLRPGLYRVVAVPRGWKGRGARSKRRVRVG